MTAGQLLNHPFISSVSACEEKTFQSSGQPWSNPYTTTPTKTEKVEEGGRPKLSKNPVSLERDDEFEELLNSFDTKIKSAKNLNSEDKDDW